MSAAVCNIPKQSKCLSVAFCAFFFYSAVSANAGCKNKERPATPTNLNIVQERPSGSFALLWTQNQTRSGLTYYDIHLRGPTDQDILFDITGGAGQPSIAGRVGGFVFSNIKAVSDYSISMKARTKPGTGGCVSTNESAVLRFKGPLGGAPAPLGLPGVFPGNVGR